MTSPFECNIFDTYGKASFTMTTEFPILKDTFTTERVYLHAPIFSYRDDKLQVSRNVNSRKKFFFSKMKLFPLFTRILIANISKQKDFRNAIFMLQMLQNVNLVFFYSFYAFKVNWKYSYTRMQKFPKCCLDKVSIQYQFARFNCKVICNNFFHMLII